MLKKNSLTDCRALILQHFNRPVYRVNHLVLFKNSVLIKTKKSTSCSDFFEINLVISENKIKCSQFSGLGCVISVSALDLLLTEITGKLIPTVIKIIQKYLDLIQHVPEDTLAEELGNLHCFDQIARKPHRIHCASAGAKAILEYLTNRDSGD